MKSTIERAAQALEMLPEELRERAVAYLEEQAERFRVLEALVAEGMSDVETGCVSEWSFEEFIHKARSARPRR
jgi:hypothetical protein